MIKTEEQKKQAVDLHSGQADTFAARYLQSGEDPYQGCFAYSRHRLDHFLRQYLPDRGERLRLLDVGCGTGHHMARLREKGFLVSGVDGSSEMLSHARLHNPDADIRHADVESLPFASERFDFVLCIEVLRYLPQSLQCIREMARVLKPGGVCLATAAPLFNLNGYWLINRMATAVPVGDLVRLKQFFTTSKKLEREFRSAGLSGVSIHGVYWGPINWVERLAPRMVPRFLRAWESVDRALADRPLWRNVANMFLVKAVRNP